MRFKIGTSLAATRSAEAEVFGLEFNLNDKELIAIRSAKAPFDITMQSFDPIRDIFYRAPESLTAEELAEEVEIQVPRSLRQKLNSQVMPGTLDGLVLMQHITSSPAISPLTALKKVLETTGSVNSSILQADNGGILFVRNAGLQSHAGASAHSLKEFLNFSKEERERIFPEFYATEVLLSGYDLDHFQDLDLGPEITSRRIALSDLTSICEFTAEARSAIEMNPHLYTLVIGAASVCADILQDERSM